MVQTAPRPEQRSTGWYEAILELGRGGMGTVYIARAVGAAGFERLVVLKRLHPHLLDEKDAVQRFLDEARMAAWVQHANVVSTHQVGVDDDGYFLVLEYVEGTSLEELVDRAALRRERIPLPIVLRIALDALAGLQAAHTARDGTGRALEILHRDVTLQNVLIGRDGVARVADFGIAKSAIGSVKTDRAYVVGKLLYLPPEYLRREAFGPELDVYSLGVTVWLALTGQELFSGASEAQLLTHILEQGIPRLSSAMEVPPRLDELIARACDRNPANRFPTARAMSEAIEAVGRETGWLATHGEVSDYVEKLAGIDLDRRRQLVAERLASGERASLDGPELPVARGRIEISAPVPVLPPARAESPAHAPSEVRSIPGERRAWPKIAAGAGVIALLIAAGLLGFRTLARSETPALASAAPTPTPAPAPPPAPTETATAAPLPSNEPRVDLAPEPTAAPATTTAARPVTTRRPTPKPKPTPKSSAPTPIRAPDTINPDNPYQQ